MYIINSYVGYKTVNVFPGDKFKFASRKLIVKGKLEGMFPFIFIPFSSFHLLVCICILSYAYDVNFVLLKVSLKTGLWCQPMYW